MPGHWIRTAAAVSCISTVCDRQMQRDEPVYLVAGSPIQTTCITCAWRRFGKQPPADLPHLEPIITTSPRPRTLLVSDPDVPTGRYVTDNWGSVGRKAKGELARMRRQQRQHNAIDPKLKQLGGDR